MPREPPRSGTTNHRTGGRTSNERPTRSQRSAPAGVVVISLLNGLGGALAILGGIALLGLSGTPGASGAVGIVGLLAVALGVADLVLAYGLWNLRSWAWTWTVVLTGLAVGLHLLAGGGNVVQMLVDVVVLLYLVPNRGLFSSGRGVTTTATSDFGNSRSDSLGRRP